MVQPLPPDQISVVEDDMEGKYSVILSYYIVWRVCHINLSCSLITFPLLNLYFM